jgi:hypothetical protein
LDLNVSFLYEVSWDVSPSECMLIFYAPILSMDTHSSESICMLKFDSELVLQDFPKPLSLTLFGHFTINVFDRA